MKMHDASEHLYYYNVVINLKNYVSRQMDIKLWATTQAAVPIVGLLKVSMIEIYTVQTICYLM